MKIMRLICDECFREEHEDDAEGWTERAGRDLCDRCSESADTSKWRDRHGDVWVDGAGGLMHTRETQPFPREHVERKWGPLIPVSTGTETER